LNAVAESISLMNCFFDHVQFTPAILATIQSVLLKNKSLYRLDIRQVYFQQPDDTCKLLCALEKNDSIVRFRLQAKYKHESISELQRFRPHDIESLFRSSSSIEQFVFSVSTRDYSVRASPVPEGEFDHFTHFQTTEVMKNSSYFQRLKRDKDKICGLRGLISFARLVAGCRRGLDGIRVPVEVLESILIAGLTGDVSGHLPRLRRIIRCLLDRRTVGKIHNDFVTYDGFKEINYLCKRALAQL
jgi:hypothetical protein